MNRKEIIEQLKTAGIDFNTKSVECFSKSALEEILQSDELIKGISKLVEQRNTFAQTNIRLGSSLGRLKSKIDQVTTVVRFFTFGLKNEWLSDWQSKIDEIYDDHKNQQEKLQQAREIVRQANIGSKVLVENTIKVEDSVQKVRNTTPVVIKLKY